MHSVSPEISDLHSLGLCLSLDAQGGRISQSSSLMSVFLRRVIYVVTWRGDIAVGKIHAEDAIPEKSGGV
jgi:hypothetical protein